jgi:hypothetical protein
MPEILRNLADTDFAQLEPGIRNSNGWIYVCPKLHYRGQNCWVTWFIARDISEQKDAQMIIGGS